MSSEEHSTDLSIAIFAEEHTVRWFVDADGVTWWVAQDVCEVLDLGNVSKACSRLDDDEKGITSSDTLGGSQSFLTVNEFGLFNLILGSRKPEAKAFRRWVTHDVLSQIWRTGRYTIPSLSQGLPLRPARRIEVSLHMAKAWRLLRTSEEWLSNQEIAQRTGIAPRTARSYTHYWLHYGLLECEEVFPRHLYRLAPEASRQYARIWQHMERCSTLLLTRAAY
jgi:prophage antirepressor-like protein